MDDSDPRDRLPLPSEDEGDLVETPIRGETDDFLVAREEGVPYVPPTERVLSEPRISEGGPDQAAAPANDEEALRQQDHGAESPDIAARALAALRSSDLVAGDRLSVGAVGSTVYLRGEVESVDVLDEILALLGDVEGVEEVADETTVRGI
ncbi:MAG TPA: BON domain-containing protein [Candidatus Limnocylindria bacterium]|nr:BON domain-containing protein [Candidatus Limnocylindria bacterium]